MGRAKGDEGIMGEGRVGRLWGCEVGRGREEGWCGGVNGWGGLGGVGGICGGGGWGGGN